MFHTCFEYVGILIDSKYVFVDPAPRIEVVKGVFNGHELENQKRRGNNGVFL